MPELPEVQTVVEELLTAGLPGEKVVGAEVLWERSVAEPGVGAFRRRVRGRRVRNVWRRGKYIVLDLSGGDHLHSGSFDGLGSGHIAVPEFGAHSPSRSRRIASGAHSSAQMPHPLQ